MHLARAIGGVILVAAGLVGQTGAGCAREQANAGVPEKKTLLRCELAAQGRFVLGEPIVVRFALHNASSRTLYALKWYTPREGVLGDIFRVTRDGQELVYLGRLVKRGSPTASDYVKLDPGGSTSANVDIGPPYQIATAGAYAVAFRSVIHDVVEDAKAVPRPADAHRSVNVSCPAIKFVVVKQ